MKIIAKNKKAFFDYEILEKIEAGIVLTGAEVKSIKSGHISLKGSFINLKDNEAFLVNAHISPYQFAIQKDYEPEKTRKILLNRKEIDYLSGKKNEGLTVLPLEIYLNKGKIKVKIGLARGKKKYEKREIMKKKDSEREIKRAMKTAK